MSYEKRSARIGGYVYPSLRQYYERLKAPHLNKSLSDVVCEVLADPAVMVIAKQKLGGPTGHQ